jgi:hypothetical protein
VDTAVLTLDRIPAPLAQASLPLARGLSAHLERVDGANRSAAERALAALIAHLTDAAEHGAPSAALGEAALARLLSASEASDLDLSSLASAVDSERSRLRSELDEAFAGASLALIMLPGPNLIYILTCSASRGRRTGIVSAAGVETATLIHVSAAVAGLSALVASSRPAYAMIVLSGAGYLGPTGFRPGGAQRFVAVATYAGLGGNAVLSLLMS